ncbi:MAG: NAD-dependent protein deacylase [Erysipelotrichaceae bacterium]|nr:NAD-dependent protein deacylase [Erysipelotrichaceae bacterium]MCR5097058.1 NAD-dependent protein deacylase [Erysipelotrichaceae bacterium]
MIKQLQNAIDKANRIVFFSGAGMSTASGIPDFRSATGLYKNVYRAEEMLSHTFFENDPELFYEFYKEKMLYPEAKPNYAHEFIARLQDKKDVSVVTQNIDGLHQAAGSKKVYELHGSILRNYCTRCHKFFDLDYIIKSDGIPCCDKCGSIIKPDVVLYEEGLDEQTISDAINAIASCDLLVVCGTSLVVYPAASFIRYFRGDTLAIVNRDATSYDSQCDIVIHDDLVKTFKQLTI